MLYNTKLNEFSAEQIDSLLSAVEMKMADLNYALSAVDFWEDSEMRDAKLVLFQKEFDTFMLWKVQLENAKNDIKEMSKPINH